MLLVPGVLEVLELPVVVPAVEAVLAVDLEAQAVVAAALVVDRRLPVVELGWQVVEEAAAGVAAGLLSLWLLS